MKKYIFLAAIIGLALLALARSPSFQISLASLATSLIKPLLVPVVELLNVPAFVYIVATLILLAGCVACVTYWMRVTRPRLRQLRAAGVAILNLPLPPSRGGNGQWPDASRDLGYVLRHHGVLVSAWAAFQAAKARIGAIPDEPFSHFADVAPSGSNERSGLMHSLPGYFTSVGLIFTFVGLVVALYFAAKGFRSGDIQEAHDSIVRLLNAASFKFLTSVAALVSALIVSLTLRASLSLISHERQNVVESTDLFLAAWRENVPSKAETNRDDAGLVDRIDSLVACVERLTQRLDRLVEARDPVSRSHAHADR